MKHVKLFESFDSGFKVISVFEGSEIYLGVFEENMANELYQKMMVYNVEPSDGFGPVIKIEDLPANHDTAVVELGGEGLFTTNAMEYENATGMEMPPVIKSPGQDYQPPTDDSPILFYANRNLGNQFVWSNGWGQTGTVSVEQMMKIIDNGNR